MRLTPAPVAPTSVAALGPDETPIHVIAVPTGTSPNGVTVNPTTNRVYVANQGSNSISVFIGATNDLVSTIPLSSRPFAVTANPLTNRVSVTHLSGNSVSVINGATNAIIAVLTVGSGPLGIAVNALDSRRVGALNSTSLP